MESKRLVALACAALMLPPPSAARAEPFEWRPVNYQIAQLLKQGRYDDALPLIERTASRCRDAATPVEAGLCNSILSENRSEVLEHRGDLTGAEAALRSQIAERSRVLPPSDKLVVQAWLFLAAFFQRHDRAADQEAALAAAERLARADPAQAQDTLGVMNARANLLVRLERPAESVALLQQAIALARATSSGPPSPVLQFNYAKALQANGELSDVVAVTSEMLSPAQTASLDPILRLRVAALLATSITASEQARAELPLLDAARAPASLAIDPAVQLAFLSGLGYATMLAGDHAKGLVIAEEAERLADRSGGLGGELIVQLARVQADALQKLGRVDDALAAVERARRRLPPADIAQRADLAVILAALLEQTGRDVAAKTALTNGATEAMGAEASRNKAYALARIGAELGFLSYSAPAAQACGEAVRLDDSGFPLGPVWLARALLCRANALTEAAPVEAHAAATRAGAVLHASSADPPLDMQRAVQAALMFSSRNENKFAEAIEQAQAVLALSRQKGEPGGIAQAFWYLGSVQRRMGRYDDALASAAQGLAIVPAAATETKAALLNGRGLVQLYQHHGPEALATLQEALALRRALRPTNPVLVAEGEGNVASALAELGQTEDAARHLDTSLDLYRRGDGASTSTIIGALVRRSAMAAQLGDLAGDEANLREALAVVTRIGSPHGAAISFALAAVLEREGRFAEASMLRSGALADVSGRFGADSRERDALRVAEAAALQASGRLRDAAQAIAGCDAAARDADVLLPCLSEQASVLLAAGEPAQAGAIADRAVAVAESGGSDPGAALTVPLVLRARAAAGVGDAGRVAASLDLLRPIFQRDPAASARLALVRGGLLTEAGDPAGAELALRDAEAAGDLVVLVGVTGVRSAGWIAGDKLDVAETAWMALLARLDAAPRLRLSVLEGLGQVELARWRFRAAAVRFEEARVISERLDGAFAPRTRDLAIERAQALARAGDLLGASATLAPIGADPSPLTSYLREEALASAAADAGDRAAALVHSREALHRAEAALGDGGLIVALARLRLAAARALAGDTPAQADLDRVVAAFADRTLSWSVGYRVEWLRGVIASAGGQPGAAEAAFQHAEAIAAEHAGSKSVLVALARANRGSVKLEAGDARAADALLKQALAMASAPNEPHGPVWASIAWNAARVARRVGDPARAARLESEALRILPRLLPSLRRYWL